MRWLAVLLVACTVEQQTLDVKQLDEAVFERDIQPILAARCAFMLPAAATFDPRDPAYYMTHVRRTFPRAAVLPGVPDRVTMRVRVQPIALEIVDALIASGDLDPTVRERVPTFDTAEVEWTPSMARAAWVSGGIPFTCVSRTNLDVRADRVEAPHPMKCAP